MEILVSTALSLILLGAVVRMFGDVGQGITNSRAMLEAADRLRLTAARLQQDLAGITVPVNSPPPHKPENNEGYFEYIEGPVGTRRRRRDDRTVSPSTPTTAVPATRRVGDIDDILMFTTRSTGQPFVGRFGAGATIQSDVAEVAWFVRGRTLYRRVLVGCTECTLSERCSQRASTPIMTCRFVAAGTGNVVPNTLGDLTKRENRFAHQTGSFPYSPYVTTASWSNGSNWSVLRLPTLCECSYYKDVSHYWGAGGTLPDNSTITLTRLTGFSAGQFDAWRNPLPYSQLDPATGAHNAYYTPGAPTAGQRIADDVILTNVIGFDVKAWDPQHRILRSPGTERSGDALSSTSATIQTLAKLGIHRLWSYADLATATPTTLGVRATGFSDVSAISGTRGLG